MMGEYTLEELKSMCMTAMNYAPSIPCDNDTEEEAIVSAFPQRKKNFLHMSGYIPAVSADLPVPYWSKLEQYHSNGSGGMSVHWILRICGKLTKH